MKRKFDVKLRKVGNSYVITVPAKIINRFKLKEGKFVTASVEIEDEKK